MNKERINRFSRQPLSQRPCWRFNKLGAILLLALLSACASKITVVADIPTPLVEKVPLNVHVNFTDEFRNHVYTENEKKRVLSSLNFAAAQEEMFTTIFGQLTTLVEVDSVERDLIIEPEILDFQYTAPAETKLKQYEVWIKYRLKILNQTSAKIADWTIKGYGKTPTALLTSATKAFNAATNVALRDVGAQLSVRFASQRKIKALIDAKNSGQSIEAQIAATEPIEELAKGASPEAVQEATEKVTEKVTETTQESIDKTKEELLDSAPKSAEEQAEKVVEQTQQTTEAAEGESNE